MKPGPSWPAATPASCCTTVKARLFRISFSGEQGYELAVPARYGDSLFRELREARAEALGGGAYGMEALNILRIEKGFITHAEIHGRVTAFDIGMQADDQPRRSCIGKAATQRPGLMDEDRDAALSATETRWCGQGIAGRGASVQRRTNDAISAYDQGYITSAGYSPTLGHPIGTWLS